MAISFNFFPPYRRASTRVVEQVGRKRTQGGAYIPEKVLIVGQYDQAKTDVTKYEVFHGYNAEDFANQFGYGSDIHRQAIKILEPLGGFYEHIYAVAVEDPEAAVAANGTVTFTDVATSSGTWYIDVGGETYQVNVASGDTAKSQAAAFAAAITADINAPVSAAVGGSGSEHIVTVTAKTKGVIGNDIGIRLNPQGISQSANNPSGTTITVPVGGYLTSGTGDIDVADVFTNTDGSDRLGDTWYTFITCPSTIADNLAIYKAKLNARFESAPNRMLATVTAYGPKTTYAQYIEIPDDTNCKFIAPVWDARVLLPNNEFGAAVIGYVVASALQDPGRPFIGIETTIPVLPDVSDLTYAQADALFRAGGGYCKVNASGNLCIGDLAVSYRLTAAGGATEEWYDLVSVTMRQQKAYAVEQLLRGEPYVRGMLTSDDVVTAKEYVIKPKKLIADLFALIDSWATEGWTKNPESVKDTVLAEINATNNSRLDAEFTDDEAKALRIIAVKAAFLY